MRFVAAWRFLTIIPLPFFRETTEKDLNNSPVFFPVVGLVIGLILAGLSLLFGLFFNRTISSILVVIAWVIITGAMHLDGLADTCDGLGGSNIDERLEIMRDSHHGTFGVTGIVCILLLRVFSISGISGSWLTGSLILAPVAGRWAMVMAITRFPYPRPSGLGTVFKKNAGTFNLIVAFLVLLIVSLVLPLWSGVIIAVVAVLVAFLLACFLFRIFGGLTGDNYGAINEIVETAVLLLCVLFSTHRWLVM